MTSKEFAGVLRRLANRIGRETNPSTFRALNDEADYIDPPPKPEPREWWIHDERRTALSYNPGNGWTHVREVL